MHVATVDAPWLVVATYTSLLPIATYTSLLFQNNPIAITESSNSALRSALSGLCQRAMCTGV